MKKPLIYYYARFKKYKPKRLVKRTTILVVLLIFAVGAYSYFDENTTQQYYSAEVSASFSPDGTCTSQIVNAIDKAKKSIFVQAYSFTSGKIAYALIRAHKRGVNVQVIFDKTNFDCHQFSFESLLIRHGIPIWDDYTPNIAHNKVMIFDDSTVETGSFNFTKAAQDYNAENIVFIKSKPIADLFMQNWLNRKNLSKSITTDGCSSRHYY